MRTRKEIERQLAKVDQSKAALEQELASIGAEIRELETAAGALLTQAEPADLRAMARQQAQARVELEAAQATGQELQRRVAAFGQERQKLQAELCELEIEEAQEAAALIAHQIAEQLRELLPTVKEYAAALQEIRRRGGQPKAWLYERQAAQEGATC